MKKTQQRRLVNVSRKEEGGRGERERYHTPLTSPTFRAFSFFLAAFNCHCSLFWTINRRGATMERSGKEERGHPLEK
jgi:hypothetical protein